MKTIEFLKRKRLILPICLFSFGTLFFLAIVWWYHSNAVVGLDEAVIQLMVVIRRAWLSWMVHSITIFGAVVFIVVADLMITALGIWKKYNGRDLLLLNFNNISGGILIQVLKMIFGRERPPLPWLGTADGYSFPSGHTLAATMFYGFLLCMLVRNDKDWLGRKWLITGLGCLPVLVGFSRVYLGVHYTSDILAGWAGGVAWVGLWMGVRQLTVIYRPEA